MQARRSASVMVAARRVVYARAMMDTGNPTPRWLDRKALAEYISVRVDHIPSLLRQGKLPQPSKHLGERTPGGGPARWTRCSAEPK